MDNPKYIKNELKEYRFDKITETRLYTFIIRSTLDPPSLEIKRVDGAGMIYYRLLMQIHDIRDRE
jgi:hypothetical protein